MRPEFTETPGRYDGPVPIVTHLHGSIGRGRRERRLRRGLVPARRGQHPGRLRHGGHLVRLLRRQGGRQLRRGVGTRVRHVPVPEPRPRGHQVVPRPHTRHDPAQRVRGARRLLHHPRRPGRRQGGPGQPVRHRRRAPWPGAEGRRQVPTQQDLLRDPDRDPGPVVQRRRLAVLPRHPRVLRRDRRPLHPRWAVLADLEPGVLRQHDHGQRQHVAVPDRRAAALPVPVPQRLPVSLPDPGLRPDPGRRGLGDRQRGRVPLGAGEPHRHERQPAADGPGRARRPDRGLHQRACGQLRPRATSARTSRSAAANPANPPTGTSRSPTRPQRDRSCSSGSFPRWRPDPTTPPQFLHAAGHHPAPGRDGDPAAGAHRGECHRVRRRRQRGRRADRGAPRQRRRTAFQMERFWMDPVTDNPDGRRPPRSGSSTTPPPTRTPCTSTRWPSRW